MLTSQREVSARDDHARLVQRCRSWLNYPAVIDPEHEAGDGHYLTLVGVDAAPSIAAYGAGVTTTGLPDRAFARAVEHADLLMALSAVPELPRGAGLYSLVNPRGRGWYVACSSALAYAHGALWMEWLGRTDWHCRSAACLIRGGRCNHAVDALILACADHMADTLSEEWLRAG